MKVNTYQNVFDESNMFADRLQNTTMPTPIDNSFGGTAWDAFKAGGAGVLGGISSFSEANLGVGQGASDYFGEIQRAGQRRKEYGWGDMVPFSSDYYTNPQGLTYDVASGLGSTATLLPATMAIGAALPEAAVAGGAGLLGAGLARAGLSRAGGWMASEAGKSATKWAVAGALGKTPEAMAEGGGTYQDMLSRGIDPEIARAQANEVAIKNVPLLMMEGAGEMIGLHGLAGALAVKPGGAVMGNIAKAGIANIGSNMVMEGATETAQQLLQENAMRRATGEQELSWFNPNAYTPAVIEAGRQGFVSGLPFGAYGAVKSLRGSNNVVNNGIMGEGVDTLQSELPNIAQDIGDESSIIRPTGEQPLAGLLPMPQQQQQIINEQQMQQPTGNEVQDIVQLPQVTQTRIDEQQAQQQAEVPTVQSEPTVVQESTNTLAPNAVKEDSITGSATNVTSELDTGDTSIPTKTTGGLYRVEPVLKQNKEKTGRYIVRDIDGNKVNNKMLTSPEAQALVNDLENATPKSTLGVMTDVSVSEEKTPTEGYTIKVGGMDIFAVPETYQDGKETRTDWSAYDMNGHPIVNKVGEEVSSVGSFKDLKTEIKKATANGNPEVYAKNLSSFKVGKRMEQEKLKNQSPINTSQMSQDEVQRSLSERFDKQGQLGFRSEKSANEFARTKQGAIVEKITGQGGQQVFKVSIPKNRLAFLTDAQLLEHMKKAISDLDVAKNSNDVNLITRAVERLDIVQKEAEQRIQKLADRKVESENDIRRNDGQNRSDTQEVQREGRISGTENGSDVVGGDVSARHGELPGSKIRRQSIEDLARPLANKEFLSPKEKLIWKASVIKKQAFNTGHKNAFTNEEIENVLHEAIENDPALIDLMHNGLKSGLNYVKTSRDMGANAYYFPNTNTCVMGQKALDNEGARTRVMLHETLHHFQTVQKLYDKEGLVNSTYELAKDAVIPSYVNRAKTPGGVGLANVNNFLNTEYTNAEDAISDFADCMKQRGVFMDYYNIVGSMVNHMKSQFEKHNLSMRMLDNAMIDHYGDAGRPSFEIGAYKSSIMSKEEALKFSDKIIKAVDSHHAGFRDKSREATITASVTKNGEGFDSTYNVRVGFSGTAHAEFTDVTIDELESKLQAMGVPKMNAMMVGRDMMSKGSFTKKYQTSSTLNIDEISFLRTKEIFDKYFTGTDGIQIMRGKRKESMGIGSKFSSPSYVLGNNPATARIYRLAQAMDEGYKKLSSDYVPFIKNLFDFARGTKMEELVAYADREREFAQVASIGDKFTVLGLNDTMETFSTSDKEAIDSYKKELNSRYNNVHTQELENGRTLIIGYDGVLHDTAEKASLAQQEQLVQELKDLGYNDNDIKAYKEYRKLMDRFFDLTSKMDRAFGRKPLEYTHGYTPHIVDRFILTRKELAVDNNGDPIIDDKGKQVYQFIDLSSHPSQSDAIKYAKEQIEAHPELKDQLIVREKNTEAKASAVKAMFESGKLTEEEFEDLKDTLGYSEQQAKDALTKDVNLYRDVATSINKIFGRSQKKMSSEQLIKELRADDSIDKEHLKNSNVIDYIKNKQEVSKKQAISYLNYIGGRHKFADYRAKRKGNQAYIKDVEKATYIYADKVFKYISQEPFVYKATKQYEKAFGKSFDQEANTDMQKYTKTFINDMRGIPGDWDSALDETIKGIPMVGHIMEKMFGHRPGSTAVRNMTQLQTAANLWFFNFSSAMMQMGAAININAKLDGDTSITNITKYAGFGKNTMDAIRRATMVDRAGKGGIGDTAQAREDAKVIRDIDLELSQNLGQDDFSDPYSLFNRGKIGKWIEKTGYLFNKGDMFFRRTAALGFYTKAGKEYDQNLSNLRDLISKYKLTKEDLTDAKLTSKGLDRETRLKDKISISSLKNEFNRRALSTEKQEEARREFMLQYAKDETHKTNFNYAKYDTPEFLRTKSAIMSNILQFKKYPTKQMEFIARELTRDGKINTPEMRTFLANVFVLGGAFGFPGMLAVGALIKSLFGIDPQDEAKKKLMKWAGTDKTKTQISKLILYGAGSFAGVDVHKRLGMGDFIPTKMADWLGPTYGWANRVLDTVQSQPMEMQTIPTLVRSAVPSLGNYALALGGESIDSSGKLGMKYTTEQKVLRSMGFIPMEEALIRDKQQLLKEIEKQRSEDIQYAMEKLNMNPKDSRAYDILRENQITSKQIIDYKKSAQKDKAQRLVESIPKKQKQELRFISDFK